MKIGIVTFTYGDNYGQRLQNYAVQKLLKTYADDVVTLPRSKLKCRGLKRVIKEQLINVKKGEAWPRLKRRKAFAQFDRKHIRYNEYTVDGNNLKNEGDFDFFVAGSDQIWSPFSHDVDGTMFLTFARPEKRVALSPSIAAKEIPDAKKELYRQYWKGFHTLSVREDESARLIEAISGERAEVLIDPTLALSTDKWNALESESGLQLKDDYILLYFLGSGNSGELVSRLAGGEKYSVVDLSDKRYIGCDPCDFLRLIKHAKMVITDSYHGTIFSMIFHVPFYVVKRKGRGPDMSSRFDTLFRIFGLDKLGQSSTGEFCYADFDTIEARRAAETSKLLAYLGDAFNKTPRD